MKLVLALWGADPLTLLGEELRHALRAAGTTRLQVNLDDDHIPEDALRRNHFEEPLTSVVTVWTDATGEEVAEILHPLADELAAWQVEERQPLVPPEVPDGERLHGLAQVTFLRKPAAMAYDDWQAHWQGPHTEIAIATQATFGHVQNRVVATLTASTLDVDVDAVVEELFPIEAMHDIHAYYGSGGDHADLDSRLMQLMMSGAMMGADHDLDVVATSRYAWNLTS